jgi:hypothetical protein
MSMTVKRVSGTVHVNNGVVGGNPLSDPYTSNSGGDLVWLDPYSQAQIFDGPNTNGPLAATLSTQQSGPTNVQTNSPPVTSNYVIYYNYSYRWKLACPGGSIGVRI